VVLGIFGLRALQADKFRLAQLMRREQEEALSAIRNGFAGRTRAIGDALQRHVARPEIASGQWEGARRILLGRVQADNVPGHIMLVRPSGEFFYVTEGFVVLPDAPDRTDALPGKEFQEAERLEFLLQRPGEAASAYAAIAAGTTEPELRLLALNALGRCHFRQRNYRQALEAYRELVRRTPEVLTRDTAVLSLIAGLQLGLAFEKLGKGAQAVPELTAIYRDFLERRWIVSTATLRFYSSEYETAIEGYCGEHSTDPTCTAYRGVKVGKEQRLRKTAELEAVRQALLPALTAWQTSEPSAGRKTVWLPATASLAVVVRSWLAARDHASEVVLLGSVLGEKMLLDLLQPGNRSGFSIRENARVRVESREGKVLLGAGSRPPPASSLKQSLGEGLPDWKLTLLPDPTDNIGQSLSLRRNLYLLLTGVLMLLLFLGGFLIVRTVNREMDVVRIKTDFVSLVSHEFKSPIASIRTLVERLQAGSVNEPARKQLYFDVVAGELQRLTRLVNNVLDFSKIEAGRKEYLFAETDLAGLAKDLVVTFEPLASQKGLRIESEIPPSLPPVRVDRDSISQAILNLLDNAAKHSEKGTTLKLRLEPDTSFLFVRVSDQGRGIPAEDIPRIFLPSYRNGDTGTRRVAGAGLGLSVVQHVMKSHGGNVTVESRVGQGSTFTLAIPLTREPTAESGEAS
jgi:signal transduction histidine kinase